MGHAELQALESLAVGHGKQPLENIPILLPSTANLSRFYFAARSEPFKIVFGQPHETTQTVSDAHGDFFIETAGLILGSSLWVALILFYFESAKERVRSACPRRARRCKAKRRRTQEIDRLKSCAGSSVSESSLRPIDGEGSRGEESGSGAVPGSLKRWIVAMAGPVCAVILLFYIIPTPGSSTAMQSMVLSPQVDSNDLSSVYWQHLAPIMHLIIGQLDSLAQSTCTCSSMLAPTLSSSVANLFQFLTSSDLVPHVRV